MFSGLKTWCPELTNQIIVAAVFSFVPVKQAAWMNCCSAVNRTAVCWASLPGFQPGNAGSRRSLGLCQSTCVAKFCLLFCVLNGGAFGIQAVALLSTWLITTGILRAAQYQEKIFLKITILRTISSENNQSLNNI